MYEIFISYRRDDAAGYVDQLYADLVAKYGEKAVFIDRTGIEPGGDFPEILQAAAENAKIALIAIAPNWPEVADEDGNRRLDDPQDWVAKEVRIALEHVPWVVPVLLGGAALPQKDDLPKALQGLTDKQQFEISRQRREFDLKQLLRKMDGWLRRSRSRAMTLRQAWVPAAAALLLMLLIWWTQLLSSAPMYGAVRDALDRLASKGSQTPFDQVALIVDREEEEATVERRRQRRHDHARLIEGLSEVGAPVVAFDYYFDQALDVDATFDADEALRGALASSNSVVLGTRDTKLTTRDVVPGTVVEEEHPLIAAELLEASGRRWGLIELSPEEEPRFLPAIEIARFQRSTAPGVTSMGLVPSLPLRAVMLWHGDSTRARFDQATETIHLIRDDGKALKPIPVHQESRGEKKPAVLLFRFRFASEDLPSSSYDVVLDELEQSDSQALADEYGQRIVLVGSDADVERDHFGKRRGYQVHAQIIANLLSEKYVRTSRPLEALGLVLCVALGAAWRLRRRRPEEIVESRSPYRHWLLAGADLLGGILLLTIPLLVTALVVFRVEQIRLPEAYWMLAFALTYLLLTVAERRKAA